MPPRKAKPELIFKAVAPTTMKLVRDQVMDLVLRHFFDLAIPFNKTDLAGFEGLSKFPHKTDFVFRFKTDALKSRGMKSEKKLVLHLTRIVPYEWRELINTKDIQEAFLKVRHRLLERQTRGKMGSETPKAYVSRRMQTLFPHLQFTNFVTARAGGTKSACTRFLCWYEGYPIDFEVFHPNRRNPFA